MLDIKEYINTVNQIKETSIWIYYHLPELSFLDYKNTDL